MEKFNFTPKGDVKRSIRYLDRTIEFENGSFQVQKIGINPIITFEMTFENTHSNLKELEKFYLKHRKSERFLFEYDNEEYICMFTNDYAPTDTFGWTKEGRVIAKVSVNIQMRVCNI